MLAALRLKRMGIRAASIVLTPVTSRIDSTRSEWLGVVSVERFDREAAYEIGRQIAVYFHKLGLLAASEVEAFQAQLRDETGALVGGLDDCPHDWIKDRV